MMTKRVFLALVGAGLVTVSLGGGVMSGGQAGAQGTTYSYAGSQGRPSVQVSVASNGAQTLEVNDIALTDSATVTGTVNYLPRIAMPSNAVLEVSLVDVNRADASAEVLASQSTIFDDHQVPIPFELVYSPDQIDPRLSYAVKARILVDGQLQFINTSQFAVITRGNPTYVDVRVDSVSR